jgi:hypothetical protein
VKVLKSLVGEALRTLLGAKGRRGGSGRSVATGPLWRGLF